MILKREHLQHYPFGEHGILVQYRDNIYRLSGLYANKNPNNDRVQIVLDSGMKETPNINSIKPILVSLSDVEKDQKWRNFSFMDLEQDLPEKKCVAYHYFWDYLLSSPITPERIQNAPYPIFKQFLDSSVDVFGLITHKLAIDVKTTKEVVA